VVERSADQVVLLGYHPAVNHQAHDHVLLAPIRALAMEERGVGVSVLEHCDTGSLSRYGALKGGKAQVGNLNLFAQAAFACGQWPVFLRLVKLR